MWQELNARHCCKQIAWTDLMINMNDPSLEDIVAMRTQIFSYKGI
jgi:hypothetical protein